MDFAHYQKQQINAEVAWKTRRTVLLLILTMLTLPLTIIFASAILIESVGRRAKVEANEKTAIELSREITAAQIRYHRSTGEFGNFDQLRGWGWLDPSLTGETPSRSGYVFNMAITLKSETGIPSFSLVADPESSSSGARHFFVSSSDYVIRSNPAQPATRADPPVAQGSDPP